VQSLEWRPWEGARWTASYLPLHRIRARIGQTAGPLEFYAEGVWDTETWIRADRVDDDDRLFYDEKRAELGVRWTLSEGTVLTAAGGYAWDRRFVEGERLRDAELNEIELDAGVYVGGALTISLGRIPRPAPKTP
jgi:hypothetical protein